MSPKPITLIKNLIFVPTCASCRERLSPIPNQNGMTHGKICFCNACAEKWYVAKAEMCPVCSETAEFCSCVPAFFKESQPYVPALCYYHPELNDTQSSAILTMKHQKAPDLFDFMAIELQPKIAALLEKQGISGSNCIFTWTPRKRSSVSKNGFDQGKELAQRTAKLFDAHAYPLFLRFGGKEQKKLDKKARKKNAAKALILNHALLGFPRACKDTDLQTFIAGKHVVIIDDVLTTGATLSQAISLLRSAGAGITVVACIAKSERKEKKK